MNKADADDGADDMAESNPGGHGRAMGDAAAAAEEIADDHRLAVPGPQRVKHAIEEGDEESGKNEGRPGAVASGNQPAVYLAMDVARGDDNDPFDAMKQAALIGGGGRTPHRLPL